MAWVETGWGGAEGCPPPKPRALWGDRAQGAGQCVAGHLQPCKWSLRSRALVLLSRQGAKRRHEDWAQGKGCRRGTGLVGM